jgi:predicted component of type VI protein secretion system
MRVATLAVYRGEQLLRKVELGEGPMRIGRAPENEIVLEDANKGVSRMHAEIRYEEGRYIILDLNSQNGVWIKERRIKVDPLPVDEPVTVGPYRLVLLPTPSPSSSTSIPGTVISSLPAVQPAREPTARVPAVEATSGTQQGAKTQPAAKTQTVVAPPAAKAGNKGLVIAGVAVAAVAAVGVFAMLNRRQPPPPPAPVETAPPVAPATTTVPPAGPTDEERFQDHFAKAQGFIEKGDKASAAAENTEAVAILPSDPRGLKQRTDIEAMGAVPPVPPAVTPPTAPVAPPVAATAAPPPASTLKIPLKSGESVAERNAREKLARSHLDDGKRALEEKRFSDAIDLLQRALDTSDRPDFGYTAGEAASLLKQARTAKATADATLSRERAQKLVDQAKALAGSDIVAAVRRLREALALDPKAPGANELMSSLQDQIVAQGEAALTSAKNFDRYKKTADAAREFDRAIQLLELVPGGHKDLAFAKQRSAELKSPR